MYNWNINYKRKIGNIEFKIFINVFYLIFCVDNKKVSMGVEKMCDGIMGLILILFLI